MTDSPVATCHGPSLPPAFTPPAALLAMNALISSGRPAPLPALQECRGFEVAAAVGLGSQIGPSQVGARIIEMLMGRRLRPIWTMVASVTLIATGVILLLMHHPLPALA